VRFISFYFFYL